MPQTIAEALEAHPHPDPPPLAREGVFGVVEGA